MKKTALSLIAAIAIGTAGSAGAAVINPVLDGGWADVDFLGADTPWADQIEFSLIDSAWFLVTDYLVTGDIFSVSINGLFYGQTSDPSGATAFTANPTQAYLSPDWSSAAYKLSAGNYIITGMTVVSPSGLGNLGVMLTTTLPGITPVPLPASALLLGGALGVAGLLRRRRSRA